MGLDSYVFSVAPLLGRRVVITGVTPHQWGGAFGGFWRRPFEHMKIGNVE
jgi:hypothetical protein